MRRTIKGNLKRRNPDKEWNRMYYGKYLNVLDDDDIEGLSEIYDEMAKKYDRTKDQDLKARNVGIRDRLDDEIDPVDFMKRSYLADLSAVRKSRDKKVESYMNPDSEIDYSINVPYNVQKIKKNILIKWIENTIDSNKEGDSPWWNWMVARMIKAFPHLSHNDARWILDNVAKPIADKIEPWEVDEDNGPFSVYGAGVKKKSRGNIRRKK